MRRPFRTALFAVGASALLWPLPGHAQRQPDPSEAVPPTAAEADGRSLGTASTPAARAGMPDAPASFSSLAKTKLPAVVTITATGRSQRAAISGPGGPEGGPFGLPPGNPFEDFLDDFFGPQGPGGGQGGGPEGAPARRALRALNSGFVIDPTGFIVTNNHVVEGADRIEVALQEGRRLEARVIGTDPATDIALLKVETDEPLPALAWGRSATAEVGDWVLAIGNPFGLGGSVTSGIISARARDIGAGNYDDFLQTDAAINTGNSGGPLIAMDGDVIGVNTAIFSRTGGNIGIGFAVPSEIAAAVTEELREKGYVTRGFLGVSIQQLTPEIREGLGIGGDQGALVASVGPDTPAAEAGIRPGDIVVSLNGRPIENPRDLSRTVADTDPGQSIDLSILRDGKQQELEVAVGELPREEQVASADHGSGDGQGPLGLALAPMSPQLRERYEIAEDAAGAVVVGVAPGSPAAELGFTPGDVIARANRQEVRSPDDLSQAVQAARKAGQKHIALLRRTTQGSIYVPVPLEGDAG